MEREISNLKEFLITKIEDLDEKLSRKLDLVQPRTAGCGIPAEVAEESRFDHPRDDHVRVEPGSACATGGEDIQGDFAALKDSLARVKLPKELRLNESRQGIKRSDQPVLNVVTKCSRYSETAVKLLSTIAPGEPVSQEKLDQLFLVAHAQCKYLQDEFAALLVNSQFDNSTARIFRSLQRNTSGLNSDSLDTLRSAATLAAASRPQRDVSHVRGAHSQFTGGRGRARGGYRRYDAFDGFTQRAFPQRRFRDENRATSAQAED